MADTTDMRKLEVLLLQCGHDCSYFHELGYIGQPVCSKEYTQDIPDYKNEVGYFPSLCRLPKLTRKSKSVRPFN